VELVYYNRQIAESEDDKDEEEDEEEVVSPRKHAKQYIRNDFVDNSKDLDDVSSFGLGGNDDNEFGDVSTRLITHFVTCFVTCFDFNLC
jgi:hypothetical protein